MDGANVLKPYSPLTETRSLFNNPKLSDVRFLVDGQTIYGHKQILALGSPVFERMFFGNLKEQREVIEIEDLSLVGFKNALRYIYGYPIDFELFNLYESYMAADKYLLYHFGDALFEYIKGRLTAESSCLIYEQLMKIGEREEISLASIRTWIIENSKATLESEHFTQVDQETLIGLLSLDKLTVDENELLAAVSKWVDCEVQRQGLPANDENRRKVFDPIKPYILFSSLTVEQISDYNEIAKLLTPEERGALVLHVVNKKNPWAIELKTPRNVGSSMKSVFISDSVHCPGLTYSRDVRLSVSRRVRIQTIFSTYSQRDPGAKLQILDSNWLDLGLKIEKSVKDGRLCFSIKPPLDAKPNCTYTLIVTGNGNCFGEDQLSEQKILNFKGLEFNLDYSIFRYSGHCIRGLEFLPSV